MQQFFRLDNPPQPNECLEASQRYCEELEQRVIELKRTCREQEDEVNSLKNDLENSHHTQVESKGRADLYESQFATQDTALQVFACCRKQGRILIIEIL